MSHPAGPVVLAAAVVVFGAAGLIACGSGAHHGKSALPSPVPTCQDPDDSRDHQQHVGHGHDQDCDQGE